MTAKIIARTADEVVPRPVRFLCEPTIPLGEPTILAGPPGLGKTQLGIGIAARATTGKLTGALHGEPVHVAYVSAEDSLEYTLVPRFIAAGGDPSRVHFFEAVQRGEDADPTLLVPDHMRSSVTNALPRRMLVTARPTDTERVRPPAALPLRDTPPCDVRGVHDPRPAGVHTRQRSGRERPRY